MRFLAALIVGAIYFGIFSLPENEKYKTANKWWKDALAFVIGVFVAFSFPFFISILQSISLGWIGADGALTQIWVFILSVLTNAASAAAGLYCFYYLSTNTNRSVIFGYVYCFVFTVLLIWLVYHQFAVQNNILNGIINIVGLVLCWVGQVIFTRKEQQGEV